MEDEYVMTNEYIIGNAVVRAFHPVLTDEERERRRKEFEEAAADFYLACHTEKEKVNQEGKGAKE